MTALADKRQLAPYSTETIRSFALQSHSVRKRYQGEAGPQKIKQMSRGQLEDLLCSVFYYASSLAENFISMLPAPQPSKQKSAPQSVKAAAPQPPKPKAWFEHEYNPCASAASDQAQSSETANARSEPKAAPIGSRAERAMALRGQGRLASTAPHPATTDSRAGRAMRLAGFSPSPEDDSQ